MTLPRRNSQPAPTNPRAIGVAETATLPAPGSAPPLGHASVDGRDSATAWIDHAGHGEACIYYRGHLQVDRSARNVKRAQRHHAADLGAVALDAERRGLVVLVQRRHDADDYSYLMIRTAVAAPTSD